MDPNACLRCLLDAFRDGDREAAYGPLEDLLSWISSKNGFLPRDPRIELIALLREAEAFMSGFIGDEMHDDRLARIRAVIA